MRKTLILLILKWSLFVGLGVAAFGVGLYFGDAMMKRSYEIEDKSSNTEPH